MAELFILPRKNGIYMLIVMIAFIQCASPRHSVFLHEHVAPTGEHFLSTQFHAGERVLPEVTELKRAETTRRCLRRT
jgi:hypothetical protein